MDEIRSNADINESSIIKIEPNNQSIMAISDAVAMISQNYHNRQLHRSIADTLVNNHIEIDGKLLKFEKVKFLSGPYVPKLKRIFKEGKVRIYIDPKGTEFKIMYIFVKDSKFIDQYFKSPRRNSPNYNRLSLIIDDLRTW